MLLKLRNNYAVMSSAWIIVQIVFAVFAVFVNASDQVRLVGGSVSHEGRVEIYHNGIWGTVCDDGWTYEDARVVCRQLGYPDALQATGQAHFGGGSGQIWMDGVRCLGTESGLQDCRFNGWRYHDCIHEEDAGVICNVANLRPANMTVRLVNGSSLREGRVEVWHNGMYGTICDDFWDIKDASVVCRQLGYSGAESASRDAAHGQGIGLPIWLDDVRCRGTETRIEECAHLGWRLNNCDHSEDAGAKCFAPGVSFDDMRLRLVNGSFPGEGRVEILWNRKWGTLCDDYWDRTDASVVCQQLGYPGALLAVTNGRFGMGSGPIWVDNVHCLGSESRLQDCHFGGFGIHNCEHSEDAGVVCAQNGSLPLGNTTVPVRLVGSNRAYQGRVEVFFGGSWGTICDDFWSLNDATVVCRQLGFEGASTYVRGAYFGEGTGPILMDNVNCLGTEAQLADCMFSGWGVHNCFHVEDAGVVCADGSMNSTDSPNYLRTVRLVNGEHPWMGRLEILHNGVWGTVCDDAWTSRSARVVCRQLGYSTSYASFQKDAFYGRGRGTIWLDDVRCSGNELRLEDCSFFLWGTHNCGHHEDVGVSCGVAAVSPTLLPTFMPLSCPSNKIYRPCGPVCPLTCDSPYKQQSFACVAFCTEGCFCTSGLLEYHGNCVRQDMCPGGDAPTVIPPGQTVRLVDGNSIYEGRVEIFHNGQWGSVCDDSWTLEDARVVCRQLGFGDAIGAYSNAFFGEGLGKPIWLDDVTCSGFESQLETCHSPGFGFHDCQHSEDAGVRCDASTSTPSAIHPIRLVGGSSSMEGRVEIYYNGVYGTVCNDNWDMQDAIVVCHELGYETAVEAVSSASFGPGNGPIWLRNVQCTGYEARLEYCRKSSWGADGYCYHQEDAGVRCTDSTVRLVGGTSPNEGRLEVLHNGQWGTICDDSWDLLDAHVACGQVGYTGADRILDTTRVNEGTGPILMDDVKCNGEENRLEVCQFRGWGVHDCFHSEDVRIACSNTAKFSSDSVRLFGGSSSNEGVVEVLHNGKWKGICDDSWDDRDATVVCRQLGFHDAEHATKSQGGYSLVYWMDEVDCSGSEDAIEKCPFSGWGNVGCGLGKGAGVVCKDEDGKTDIGIIVVPSVILFVTFLCTVIAVCWKKHNKRRSPRSLTLNSISYSAERQSASIGTASPYPEKAEMRWAAPRLFVEMPEPPSYGDAVDMPIPQPLATGVEPSAPDEGSESGM